MNNISDILETKGFTNLKYAFILPTAVVIYEVEYTDEPKTDLSKRYKWQMYDLITKEHVFLTFASMDGNLRHFADGSSLNIYSSDIALYTDSNGCTYDCFRYELVLPV